MESWNINGHLVEYDDDGHVYLVDGIITPSVTQILKRKYKDEFKFVKAEVMEEASANGSAMHKVIELYETGKAEIEIKELRNYKFLKKAYNFENVENEVPIIYEQDGKVQFAGRLDQIIELDGTLGINDFKRVSAPNKEKICYQLNLYKLGYEQSYNKKIEHLHFTQLREDKRKFVPLPINEKMALELLKGNNNYE